MEYEKSIKMPTNIGQDVNYENPSFQTPYQEWRDKPKIVYGTWLLWKPKFVLQTITTGTWTYTFYAPNEKPD